MLSFRTYLTEISKIDVSHNKVLRVLKQLDNKIVDKELPPSKIVKMFEQPLNSIVPCNVTKQTSNAVSLNTVNITAFFDGDVEEDDEEWGDYQFEFIMIFNPSDKKIKISKDYWNWFKNELADAIVHEMIHRSQARSRNYSVNGTKYLKGTNSDQRYYGQPDEIEAFAVNAAHELKRKFKGRSISLLANTVEVSKSSPSIQRYLEVFQSTEHPVVKRFLKKVYQYLKTI